MRVLFTPKFVRELLAKLDEVEEENLLLDHRLHRRNCVENATEVRKAMLRECLALPGESIFKLVASVGNPRGKAWLEIVIDVSEEALIYLHGTDPLNQEKEF